ncbi:MAG: hypothetical protein OXD54_03230 [Candidatus Poribacteria bacterium]|nr:hypothetical protein [Candidatus Poribacteria bacterium]
MKYWNNSVYLLSQELFQDTMNAQDWLVDECATANWSNPSTVVNGSQ